MPIAGIAPADSARARAASPRELIRLASRLRYCARKAVARIAQVEAPALLGHLAGAHGANGATRRCPSQC